MPKVTLDLVTDANRRDVIALAVNEEQKAFVATNRRSLDQAAADPGAWPRAIVANGTPVGFIMLHDETLKAVPEEPGYIYLWRMMVDQRYQGLGYGADAIRLVVNYARTRPDATRIVASYIEGEASAAGFYKKLEFRKTGQIVGGETEIELIL